jgi:predicted Rossmann fold flavoprotein
MNRAVNRVAVIGGGAAGFFASIRCAALNPVARVLLLEKSGKVLSKVKVSGGGRCNVTNATFDPRDLVDSYPRGSRHLRGLFTRFGPADTVRWFEEHGVRLKTEGDGRIFPVSDSSQTIIDCLVSAAKQAGVVLCLNSRIVRIRPAGAGFELETDHGEVLPADKVLVATGGTPSPQAFDWLRELGHTIQPPVPSLFSFNIADPSLRSLSGLSVESATVNIRGQRMASTGPLLVTHWGLSGPAILKLSAFGARFLAEAGYRFDLLVNWTGTETMATVSDALRSMAQQHPARRIRNDAPAEIPRRLWSYLAEKCGIDESLQWANVPGATLRKLAETIAADRFRVEGKTTFKEEFVTCGGVDLDEVDLRTMESKRVKGLYFAGEVLDIDGITGGFNFQSAWSAGYIAGTAMAAF